MRVATWNVNSIRARKDHLLRWLELRKYPEIVCLQETKVQDQDFPVLDFEKIGYHTSFWGQKSYNGVAVLSTDKIVSTHKGFGKPELDKEARVIYTQINQMKILNIYVPNGQIPQSEKYIWKFEFLHALEELVNQLKPDLICGDFNIAPQEIDVWDAQRFKGHIMFTPAERHWFNQFLKAGWVDLYRNLNPDKREYSWFDYITKAFIGNRGWRIDFILTSPQLAKTAKGCVIDTEPRGWDKPSDHCPVVAKFTIRD